MSMYQNVASGLVVVIGALGTPAASHAVVLMEYDAGAATPAPNPTSAAGGTWTAGGSNPAGVVEAAGQEGGRNYWEIMDDNAGGTTNSSRLFTLDPGAAVNDPAGWTATAVVKVLSASSAPSGTTFEVRGGGRLINIGFVNDGTSEFVAHSVGGNTPYVTIADMDLDSDYNTFQLWFDPSDNLVDVYINGAFASTITPGASGVSRVLWGSNTSSATGTSRWSEVRFETGFAIVPEPAAVGLMGVGLVALVARRRRRGA